MSDLDARADDEASKLGDVAAAAGIGRVHFLAWRDLDDPEAGGSEGHASRAAGRALVSRSAFALRTLPG